MTVHLKQFIFETVHFKDKKLFTLEIVHFWHRSYLRSSVFEMAFFIFLINTAQFSSQGILPMMTQKWTVKIIGDWVKWLFEIFAFLPAGNYRPYGGHDHYHSRLFKCYQSSLNRFLKWIRSFKSLMNHFITHFHDLTEFWICQWRQFRWNLIKNGENRLNVQSGRSTHNGRWVSPSRPLSFWSFHFINDH